MAKPLKALAQVVLAPVKAIGSALGITRSEPPPAPAPAAAPPPAPPPPPAAPPPEPKPAPPPPTTAAPEVAKAAEEQKGPRSRAATLFNQGGQRGLSDPNDETQRKRRTLLN